MTFEQYWVIFIKQWRLIVICFVFVGLGAYIGSRLIHPTYQAAALVQIAIRSSNNQMDNNSLLASDQLVQTEAQLAVSYPVLREVASHYPDLTVEQLSKAVTSTPKPNTQLFEIDVQDANPIRAAALANDIATTLIKQQVQVIQQDNSQSRQQIQQDLTTTRQQIDSITTQIAALQAKGGNLPQMAVLQAELTGLQQHYSQWQTALAQLELTQAQSGDFLRVAQPAQPEKNPMRPNVLLNTAAGFLGGLLLGILLALMFERLDTRVRTPEALSQLLDWSILATIWRTNPKEDVINPAGRNTNVEAYRILRTNIGFAAIDKPLQTIVVTSALPRDGKSVVAANLAIFMAKAGKKTLLIDADLRRPSQHEIFGLSPDKMGLSNAILAFSTPAAAKAASHYQFPTSMPVMTSGTLDAPKSSLDPFVHPVDIPNLCVMPSGPMPPNPSELLDSKALHRLFTTLTSCGAEVVIVDTPPLLGMPDASILASKVDGTLFVADITRADKRNLVQVKALLEKAGARILGCVVNKQRQGRNDAIYSYYYYRPDEQQDRRNSHRTKNANSAAVSPFTVDTQSRPDISNGNTVKTASINSVQPEIQFRSDLLDGRKGG